MTSSYHHANHQQLQYNSKGTQSRSDGYRYGYKKTDVPYDNASGYYGLGGGSYGSDSGYGGGSKAGANRNVWSGSYGDYSDNHFGGRNGSNQISGGQTRSGGCIFHSYANGVKINACSVLPSYRSETHLVCEVADRT